MPAEQPILGRLEGRFLGETALIDFGCNCERNVIAGGKGGGTGVEDILLIAAACQNLVRWYACDPFSKVLVGGARGEDVEPGQVDEDIREQFDERGQLPHVGIAGMQEVKSRPGVLQEEIDQVGRIGVTDLGTVAAAEGPGVYLDRQVKVDRPSNQVMLNEILKGPHLIETDGGIRGRSTGGGHAKDAVEAAFGGTDIGRWVSDLPQVGQLMPFDAHKAVSGPFEQQLIEGLNVRRERMDVAVSCLFQASDICSRLDGGEIRGVKERCKKL